MCILSMLSRTYTDVHVDVPDAMTNSANNCKFWVSLRPLDLITVVI